MAAVFPSGSNTFVKDHAATAGMVVNYSRNPDDFDVNKYTQIRPVEKEAGYYLVFTVQEAGRILNANLSDFVWADGQPRPERLGDTESFEFLEYKTKRKEYGFMLGRKAIQQAGFPLQDTLAAIKAQQAMTARTQMVYTALTTAASYDSGHDVDVATEISGNTGNWGQSTTQRQDVKRSLNYGVKTILQATLSVVKPKDLVLVMGPDTAMEVAECQEIVDHVKGSPEAWAQVKGDLPGANALFGLPNKLYNIPVVVDVTYKVTSHKGATDARSAIWASGTAILLSRPGALVNTGGGPSFSSATVFSYEEMTVETLDDDVNRRTKGSVVDDNTAVMTAPAATFRYTDAV